MNIAKVLIFVFFVISFNSRAQIPEGFGSFFEVSQKELKLRNLDGSFMFKADFLTTYNSVKVDKDNHTVIRKIKEYLKYNEVREFYHDAIIDKLVVGIKDTPNVCVGYYEDCQITPEVFQFLYDLNNDAMYLFVEPEVLKLNNKNDHIDYHPSYTKENGFINEVDLYASFYSGGNNSLIMSDRATLGLDYGYIRTDFTLSSVDHGSDLYETIYQYDVNDLSFSTGFSKYHLNSNTTDFLNVSTFFPQYFMSLNSSKKMLIGGENSAQIISFYSPQDGVVEVTRNGRLIYQRNVKQGTNTISYNALPYGRYTISVKVINNGQVVSEFEQSIYNTSSDSLSVFDFDYAISGGMLGESEYTDNDLTSPFVKGALSYRVLPSLMFGISGLWTEMDNMLSVGAIFNDVDTDFGSELVLSSFSEINHVKTTLGFPIFNFSYERFNKPTMNDLAEFMYGSQNYTRYALNASYNFGGGRSFYAIYNDNHYMVGDDSENRYNVLSLGYSTPTILKSKLDLNYTYSDSNEEHIFNVHWTLPLTNSIDSLFSITSNQEQLQQVSTSLRANYAQKIGEEYLLSNLELRNTYDTYSNESNQQLSVNTNGDNNKVRYNANGYVNTQGNNGLVFSLSSSQVVTNSDSLLTSKPAKAYALINVTENKSEGIISSEKGYLTLRRNGSDEYKEIIYDESSIFSLKDYSYYNVSFDSESVGLYNSGQSQVEFLGYPGVVVTLKPKVNRIVSFVSAFYDLSERKVSKIDCIGDGCVSVIEIIDGVYQVSVLEGVDFDLISNDESCLLPYSFSSTRHLNFGQNYCLPIKESEVVKVVDNEKDKYVLFIGMFSEDVNIETLLMHFQDLGYSLLKKNVGDFYALYLESDTDDFRETLADNSSQFDSLKSLTLKKFKAERINLQMARLQ